MSVSEVLRRKGDKVITIRPEQSIHDAIRTLTEHSVGALLVMDEKKQILGILTERDILRENARHFDELKGVTVADIMSTDVIIGLYSDSLDYVMNLMTEKRIRHLPIMKEGQLAGIVSIGDVVKTKVKHAEVEIHHLKDYIMDKYPG